MSTECLAQTTGNFTITHPKKKANKKTVPWCFRRALAKLSMTAMESKPYQRSQIRTLNEHI